VDALLAAGWPGERVDYEAGVARVYTTIQRLRALGLQNVLVTQDDGYLLDPSTPVRIDAHGGS
jgi:biotin operon repressor